MGEVQKLKAARPVEAEAQVQVVPKKKLQVVVEVEQKTALEIPVRKDRRNHRAVVEAVNELHAVCMLKHGNQ